MLTVKELKQILTAIPVDKNFVGDETVNYEHLCKVLALYTEGEPEFVEINDKGPLFKIKEEQK